MQHAVRHLRAMEKEAKAGLTRQARLYERIRAARLRAEAIEGRDGDDGNGYVIIGPWAAAVALAGIAGKVLFGTARRTAATASLAVAAAGGIGLSVIQTPHHPPSNGALPARPPVSPPGVRSTPTAGPPKTGPPAAAVPDVVAPVHTRRQQPSVAVTVAQPSGLPSASVEPPVDTGPLIQPPQTAVPPRCAADLRLPFPVRLLCSPNS